MTHKYLEPAFGRLILRDLSTERLQLFFTCMAGRGIPYPTIIKVRDALSSILRSAKKFKYIQANPLDDVEMPADKRGELTKPVLIPQQFRSLLLLIPEPYATMVYVATYTGLRVSGN